MSGNYDLDLVRARWLADKGIGASVAGNAVGGVASKPAAPGALPCRPFPQHPFARDPAVALMMAIGWAEDQDIKGSKDS